MQQDYEIEDEDAYEGPDAYVEGDEIMIDAEQIDDVDPEFAAAPPENSVQGILQSLLDLQESEAQNGPGGGGTTRTRISTIGLHELTRLLASASGTFGAPGGNGVADEDEDDEDYLDEGDDEEAWVGRRGERRTHQYFPVVTEPQKAGMDLLMSGEFGRVKQRLGSGRNKVDLAKVLYSRGTKIGPIYNEDSSSNLVPNTNGTVVAASEDNIYCGQFSKDSSFYYTCSQGFELRVYDTTSPPPRFSQTLGGAMPQSRMKILKNMKGNPGRWTITDSHLSPDNERMIYSSITPTVYMTNTLDSSPAQIPIRFADPPRRMSRSIWGFDEESFGIWSCRFSADGNEVVAGGSGKIFVYDLLADRRTVKIAAHNDDVNSCCWADTASGNILISASDDSFIKVWDRRSLGSSQKPSGVLVGHTEGITNVSAKGDGRYIISNGKDQALRLWDLRKMHSSAEFDKFSHKHYGMNHYDYRYGHYPKPRIAAHPKDCSVMTYRGHQVLQTLIRCQFSPAETTGSQYIYSGSSDGKIHVWSLDGRIVQILDRSKTLPMSMDPSGPEPEPTSGSHYRVCVRDVSWHSEEPAILSVGWDSGRGGSTVARHEWKGLSKNAYRLEDWVQKKRDERGERASRRRATRRGQFPGAFENEESEEELNEEDYLNL